MIEKVILGDTVNLNDWLRPGPDDMWVKARPGEKGWAVPLQNGFPGEYVSIYPLPSARM